jgi:hypothetical protein
MLPRAAWLSFLGAALLLVPAARFRIDVAPPSSPSLGAFAAAAVFLVAVALLALGWRAVVRARPTLGQALGWGALVHATALLSPPFLSVDPLGYAAMGRAMSRFGASPYRPLRESLPSADPFLALLPAGWRASDNAYWPGFNELARLVGRVGGDSPIVHLRLFQLVGLAAMVTTAWLVGRAVLAKRPQAAGAAAAFVLLCPLAVVEGTVNAHNDALLAVAAATFALAVARGERLGSLLALAAGLTVKASGALLLVVRGLELCFRRLRLGRGAALGIASLSVAAMLAGFFALRSRLPASLVAVLIGSPSDAVEHCTRSIECLPRSLLRWGFNEPSSGRRIA